MSIKFHLFVRSLLVSILLVAVFSSPLSGQSKPEDASQETLKLRTDLVVVDAQVLNKKTALAIGNLTRDDFILAEDGVKQVITHFSQDQLPLSILLLLDTSGSVWDTINEVRDRAVEALGHLRETDEVALMATASRTDLIQDFTTDRKLLAEKIGSIDKKALGRQGILMHEAVYQAAKHMNKAANPASRRVVIVITDNVSTQMAGMGHSENEALDEVYETGVAVCGLKVTGIDAMVLKFNPMYYGLKGVLFRGDIYAYAEKTGGLVLSTGKSQLDQKLTDLIVALRSRYSIGYISTNTKQDGKFRKIKLQITPEMEKLIEKRDVKVTVITRKGYYARQKEEAAKSETDSKKNF